MEKRCWFRECPDPGEPRPTFARSHNLPMGLRLCELHLREASRDPANAAADLRLPEPH